MSILQSLILGLIQGITEFLPISSSGHLILVPKFFNWPDQGLAFDTILHLATAVAIIIVLRKEIALSLRVVKRRSDLDASNTKRNGGCLPVLILLSIIPAGLVGLLFNHWIEQNLRSVNIVIFSLIFWAIILWLSEYYNNKQTDKTQTLANINWKQAISIGAMQAIALIPGTSRSGITITGGLFSKLDKQTSVKFSFLIGLPIILVAGGLKLIEVIKLGINYDQIIYLTIGFGSALASGLLCLKLMLWLAQKSNFKIFIIYRIILGIVLLLI